MNITEFWQSAALDRFCFARAVLGAPIGTSAPFAVKAAVVQDGNLLARDLLVANTLRSPYFGAAGDETIGSFRTLICSGLRI